MTWYDDNTAVLKDTSIVIFKDDGSVELYPSGAWLKPRNKHKKGFGHCHTFKFNSRQKAIDAFAELENQLYAQ